MPLNLEFFAKYLLFPIILSFVSYSFGKYKEKNSKKIIHDKEIFTRIQHILSDDNFNEIKHQTSKALLPEWAARKSDELIDFLNNPGNCFINKHLHKNFYELSEALEKLVKFYNDSPYGDFTNDKRFYKLIYDKSGNKDNKEWKLINESYILSKNLNTKHVNFRRLIKRT